jgi:hypothetical protein
MKARKPRRPRSNPAEETSAHVVRLLDALQREPPDLAVARLAALATYECLLERSTRFISERIPRRRADRKHVDRLPSPVDPRQTELFARKPCP